MKKHSDYTILFFALGTTFLFVYFIPQSINQLLFLIFLYFFYKSNRDYLWIAFIFIIIESPGGVFSGGQKSDLLRMPIYTVIPNMSITYYHLFVLTAFFKALNKKCNYTPVSFIKVSIIILSIYFLFLIIIGLAIGSNFEVLKESIFIIINLTLYYSIYILFKKESDYINFFKLIIPFGFIAFGIQLINISLGNPLVTYLKPSIGSISGAYDIESGNVRPIEMSHIVTLLFFLSFYFLIHKKYYFNRNVLIMLNVITFFSILIDSTRSWVIMFVIFYSLSLVIVTVKFGNILLKYGVVIITILFIIFSVDVFTGQLNRATERVSTIKLFAEGDITAGGTAKRFDIRAPALIEAFYKESTVVFGAGFSEVYFKKSDPHVGFHNLLFNSGFAGLVIFSLFFGNLIFNPFKIDKRLNYHNPYKGVLKIFSIIFISMLFLNTSIQVIGYDVYLNFLLVFVFILFFLDNQIKCALKWEEEN